MQMDKQMEAYYIAIPERSSLRLRKLGDGLVPYEFHDLRFVNVGRNQYHAVTTPEIADKAFRGRVCSDDY
jgi:hypothetical protein